MKQQRPLIYVAMAIIAAFGLYLIIPQEQKAAETVTQTEVQTVTYQGVEGKNALDLLKASQKVETKSFDFGEMVVSINGRAADKNEYWAFYINGQPAQVGAGDYQTKSTDTISWRIETIQ